MKTISKINRLISAALCLVFAFAVTACSSPSDNGGGNGGGAGGDENNLPTGRDPYVLSVDITAMPYKTDYTVGETFSPDGLTFDSHWNVDGEEVVIDMNYSDCDGWTHRDAPLALDVTEIVFTLEGFEFGVPITVEQGKADIPMHGTKLLLSTTVSGSSSTSIKENGTQLDEDIVFDHVVYSKPTQYKLKGDIGGNKPYPALVVQGGGLNGTQTAGSRTKVRFMVKNTGSNPVSMHLFYDYGNAGGNIGGSKIMYLKSDETAVSEFTVRTDLVPENATPWFKIELLANANETSVAVAGYDIGRIENGKYDLSIENGEFGDGVTSVIREKGAALPAGTISSVRGTLMGWYNALDPSEKWYADGDGNVDFAMPEHDVVLSPMSVTTDFQSVAVKPRETSGGKRPEVHNGKLAKMGEADYTSEGYSDTKVKYTVYSSYEENGVTKPTVAGSPVIGGCGSHFGDDNDYDRLFKLTFTHVSGAIDFDYWIDIEYEKYMVKRLTTARGTLDAQNASVTVYLVIPKGFKVYGSGGSNFHIDPLADLTENAVFTIECAWARLA